MFNHEFNDIYFKHSKKESIKEEFLGFCIMIYTAFIWMSEMFTSQNIKMTCFVQLVAIYPYLVILQHRLTRERFLLNKWKRGSCKIAKNSSTLTFISFLFQNLTYFNLVTVLLGVF